ncbi:MAG: hypothetical protein JW915_10795 [Chitinispirillaceae bacterium]|nr:hypothetical protein [Chitinispirillaceae bacterium]
MKILKVILICLGTAVTAASYEWLADARKNGLFAHMETGIESMRSQQWNINGKVTGGKWFNEYFNIYMGVQHSFSRSSIGSFSGFHIGTDLVFYDSDKFNLCFNLESQMGSYKALYFSPGVEAVLNVNSYSPRGVFLSLNEILSKSDTSWAEDDTETVVIESKAKKIYTLLTELKIGYFRQLVQNQYLQLSVNPHFRHHAVQGDKRVDLGFIALGHKILLNRHMKVDTEFSVEIPQSGERTTLGLKISLSTY